MEIWGSKGGLHGGALGPAGGRGVIGPGKSIVLGGGYRCVGISVDAFR